MRNLLLFAISAVVAVGCSSGIIKSGDVSGTPVYTANELIRGLGSNRTLVLQAKTVYNLTPELLEMAEGRHGLALPRVSYDRDYRTIYPDGLSWTGEHDGPQLNLKGIKNLTLAGPNVPDADRPVVLVDPRYAFVFNFVDVSGIKLRNLVLGHTEEGYCSSGVLGFERSENIDISNCDLFGCGTEGIVADDTVNLNFFNSVIRDCTYSIMSLRRCEGFTFANSKFYRNREYSLVNVSASKGIVFRSCNFYENKGPLFELDSPITLDKCIVRHTSSLGTMNYVTNLSSIINAGQ